MINLSNHPVSGWSTDQLEAARALGLGKPVDFEMPQVDPDLGSEGVKALAAVLAARVILGGHKAAHVAGEPMLSYMILRELLPRGVRCFAATTRRDSVETVLPDGSVRKTAVFKFVRWREYPAT